MAEINLEIKAKNHENFIARSLRVEDIANLQKFFRQVALETTHTLICKEVEKPFSELKSKIEDAINSPSEIYLGVFDGDKIIGQLYLKAPSHPWIKHTAGFLITITADHWGKGIGSELLNLMEDFAKSIGISRIESRVRTSNERGLSLYKKMGYEIEGTRKKAAFINGQFEDEFFIAKFLNIT